MVALVPDGCFTEALMTARRVDLATGEGILDLYTFQPANGRGPWPAVILYMDAFGIRPDFDAMAQRLASAGYLVAVPNLYYRSGAFPPFDPHEVAKEGAERARFKGMIASIDGSKVMRDTAAVIRWLDESPDARSERIGTVGYCMGGGYALSAAGTYPERVRVAASFHGGSLATDRPDSPHRLASRMRAQVYVGVAAIDPSFTRDQQARLEDALRAAGVDYTLDTYEGARHGFAVNGHLAYDRAAADRHWERLLSLLRQLDADAQPGPGTAAMRGD